MTKTAKKPTPRQRVIKRLNEEFSQLIGCEIPLDQPIISHQTQFADSGGHRWYFTSLRGRSADAATHEARITAIGSTLTMTELLKGRKEWVIIKEDSFVYQ